MSDEYPLVLGLETAETYERYEVYVNSGRADELFIEFCELLGTAIEKSWKETLDV